MRKLFLFLLAVSCMIVLTACSSRETIGSNQQIESMSATYRVEIIDNSHPVVNPLENAYKAGEQITLQLETVTEGYYVVFVNDVEQPMDMEASDRYYTFFTFTMPDEDIVIRIERVSVDIPEGS